MVRTSFLCLFKCIIPKTNTLCNAANQVNEGIEISSPQVNETTSVNEDNEMVVDKRTTATEVVQSDPSPLVIDKKAPDRGGDGWRNLMVEELGGEVGYCFPSPNLQLLARCSTASVQSIDVIDCYPCEYKSFNPLLEVRSIVYRAICSITGSRLYLNPLLVVVLSFQSFHSIPAHSIPSLNSIGVSSHLA
uniref:Uncharacterized protein n=1 Tax=Picea glauca TaxID=3330 RepID=A0A101M2M9_PICGL|nr:hypothetical protein ABT39_MTgene2967 [Picea glauca]QHR89142.1 hypothetical protein Q903MT_gene3162 [Picea sitchensis]